jgi:OOP family OmpA-OmpF porin
VIVLLMASAFAQEGMDANGFAPAAQDGDVLDPLTVQHVDRFVPFGMYAGGLFSWSESPLVKVTQHRDGSITRSPVLDNVAAMDLSAGLAVHERVRIDLDAPVYFASTGLSGSQGGGLGDLRLGTLVGLVVPGAYGDSGVAEGLGLGTALWLDLPTGNEANMLGRSGLAGGAKVVAGFGTGPLQISTDLGFQANPQIDLDNLVGSDALLAGGAIGLSVAPRTGVNVEARLAAPLSGSPEKGTATTSEALFSVRHRTTNGVYLTLGGAAALSRGAGVAAYRAFVGGGFGSSSSYDGGGGKLVTSVTMDGEPYAGANLQVAGGGVVWEGVSTVEGVGLNVPAGETTRAVASVGDCRYGEATITSAAGAQLVVPLEKRWEALAIFTVTDQNGDPVPEAQVAWVPESTGCVPDERLILEKNGTGEQVIGVGKHEAILTAPGYSSAQVPVKVGAGDNAKVRVTLEKQAKVVVERERIIITDRVYFKLDSAVIESRSFALLDEVAQTLQDHPEVVLVEVRGHTDDQGSNGHNLDLSQRRAESVMAYLVARGVAKERLQAKGFGETKPLEPNTSEEGRAKNRRVEFVIEKRSD